LLLFVLGVVYSVLVMGLRSYRSAERNAQAQHEAMVAVARMVEEIAGSPEAGTRVEPQAILILSPRTAGGDLQYDAAGRLLWQKYVCFYRAADGRLLRKEKALAPTPDIPPTLPAPSTLIADEALPTSVVARDISALSFAAGSGVRLSVTATSPDGEASVTVSSAVAFRQ
jgi:hypothetical protein